MNPTQECCYKISLSHEPELQEYCTKEAAYEQALKHHTAVVKRFSDRFTFTVIALAHAHKLYEVYPYPIMRSDVESR